MSKGSDRSVAEKRRPRRGDFSPYRRTWFNNALYAVSTYVSRFAAFMFLDLRVSGRERLPVDGPCLLAANHQSFLDPWAIGLTMKRQSYYLARETLFRVPILGWLLRQYHALPVARGSASSREVLEQAIEVLRRGETILIFPEGTRTTDGRMLPLKRGISLVVKRTGAPVVPIFVRGTYEVWSRERRFPRLRFFPKLLRRGPSPLDIELHFGEPVYMAEGESAGAFMARLEQIYRDLAAEANAPGMGPPHTPATGAESLPSEDEANNDTVGFWAEGGAVRPSIFKDEPPSSRVRSSRPRERGSPRPRTTPSPGASLSAWTESPPSQRGGDAKGIL